MILKHHHIIWRRKLLNFLSKINQFCTLSCKILQQKYKFCTPGNRQKMSCFESVMELSLKKNYKSINFKYILIIWYDCKNCWFKNIIKLFPSAWLSQLAQTSDAKSVQFLCKNLDKFAATICNVFTWINTKTKLLYDWA